MTALLAACPHCQATNRVDGSLIGRYTLCDQCRCRFYVQVPPLESSQSAHHVVEPALRHEHTTLDDLLWDSHRGEAAMLFELRRISRSLATVLHVQLGLAFGMAMFAFLWIVAR